ncbi:MAG: SDR family oxidoreductase [Bacteroidota bacterium]
MSKNPIKSWNNKTVLITGAGSGIGEALSHELASRGAIVYVTTRSMDKSQPVADAITAKGHTAIAKQLEVSNFEAFKQVINEIKEEKGRLDVLINNAAILFIGEYYDMEAESIERSIRVNQTAVMVGALYAYRIMREQGSGLIVNVASMAGFLPTPAMVAYSTTKHALIGLTKSLAAEAAGSGVKVQATCLGLIKSEILKKAEVKQGTGPMYLELIPMKEMPTTVAAQKLANKMLSNRMFVYLPWYSRFYFHLQYFIPNVLLKGTIFTMKKYREMMSKVE